MHYPISVLNRPLLGLAIGAILFLGLLPPVRAQAQGQADQPKQVRIPAHLNTLPANNNFQDTASEYCYQRSIQGPDIVIFWSKQYGQRPMDNADTTRRFDVNRALKECERFYHFYVDSLKLVRKTGGVTSQYKIIFLVVGGKDNTAYGWGQDSVGVLWTPAARMSQYPYGVLAHELGHAFQYLASLDYGGRLDGPITEMAAQYMLWQVYPSWLTFEHYHLEAFMKQTHLAFEHPANTYHSPFVLEYWSEKYGKTFYSELLHQAKKKEDIVTVFKRIRHMDDRQFADDMFKGVQHFITWDLPRIKPIAAPYANQNKTLLDTVADGWYQVDTINTPQNYGYNAIRLQLPSATDREVRVQFKGLVQMDNLNNLKVPAGWRYGFVAYTKKGTTYYSDMGSKANGRLSFDVPQGTTYLWLVVMGAPGKYVPLQWRGRKDNNHYSQWPYQVKFKGADLYPANNTL